MSRDGYTVRYFINDIQFLNGNLINLIQHIDTGDINSIKEKQDINLELLTRLSVWFISTPSSRILNYRDSPKGSYDADQPSSPTKINFLPKQSRTSKKWTTGNKTQALVPATQLTERTCYSEKNTSFRVAHTESTHSSSLSTHVAQDKSQSWFSTKLFSEM